MVDMLETSVWVAALQANALTPPEKMPAIVVAVKMQSENRCPCHRMQLAAPLGRVQHLTAKPSEFIANAHIMISFFCCIFNELKRMLATVIARSLYPP